MARSKRTAAFSSVPFSIHSLGECAFFRRTRKWPRRWQSRVGRLLGLLRRKDEGVRLHLCTGRVPRTCGNRLQKCHVRLLGGGEAFQGTRLVNPTRASDVYHDNKARFSLRCMPDALRSRALGQDLYPVWIHCAQGHAQTARDRFTDNDLAASWLSPQSAEEIGDTATFAGRPLIPIEESPPRLYHRTTRDAALAIVEGSMKPGFGDSGKAHNYFAPAALEDLQVKSGVRADLPIESVYETKLVLQHAWLFISESDGVLCSEEVPGTCALYARDTRDGSYIWTRPSTEGSSRPANAEADDPMETDQLYSLQKEESYFGEAPWDDWSEWTVGALFDESWESWDDSLWDSSPDSWDWYSYQDFAGWNEWWPEATSSKETLSPQQPQKPKEESTLQHGAQQAPVQLSL